MASDILSTATFTTANMLPSPGEEISTHWAEKLADNTGAAYFLGVPLEDITPTASAEARFMFVKKASHNGIRALTRGLEAKNVTEYMRVFADGADPTDHAAYTLVGTLAYSRAAQITQRFDLDISSLTNGNVYMLAYARDNTGSSVRPSLSLVYGSNATY